jgi:hypothetical protein
MAIDFDALVLSPAMEAFAISVLVTPIKTRPGVGPFTARGVFSSDPLTVEMQDGTVFDDQQTKLGIRQSELGSNKMPGNGDRVKITETMHPHYGRVFYISDTDGDGQGGQVFQLREHTDQ